MIAVKQAKPFWIFNNLPTHVRGQTGGVAKRLPGGGALRQIPRVDVPTEEELTKWLCQARIEFSNIIEDVAKPGLDKWQGSIGIDWTVPSVVIDGVFHFLAGEGLPLHVRGADLIMIYAYLYFERGWDLLDATDRELANVLYHLTGFPDPVRLSKYFTSTTYHKGGQLKLTLKGWVQDYETYMEQQKTATPAQSQAITEKLNVVSQGIKDSYYTAALSCLACIVPRFRAMLSQPVCNCSRKGKEAAAHTPSLCLQAVKLHMHIKLYFWASCSTEPMVVEVDRDRRCAQEPADKSHHTPPQPSGTQPSRRLSAGDAAAPVAHNCPGSAGAASGLHAELQSTRQELQSTRQELAAVRQQLSGAEADRRSLWRRLEAVEQQQQQQAVPVPPVAAEVPPRAVVPDAILKELRMLMTEIKEMRAESKQAHCDNQQGQQEVLRQISELGRGQEELARSIEALRDEAAQREERLSKLHHEQIQVLKSIAAARGLSVSPRDAAAAGADQKPVTGRGGAPGRRQHGGEPPSQRAAKRQAAMARWMEVYASCDAEAQAVQSQPQAVEPRHAVQVSDQGTGY